MRLTHLILTRFSVKAAPSSPPFAIEWLRERLRLLEQFGVPAINGQTEQAFRWLLFCDETTDVEILAALERLPKAEVIMTNPRRDALAQVLSAAAGSCDVVMTSRLDSDDCIALRFVERLQAYATPFLESGHERLLVNFPHGYKLTSRGELFTVFSPHSAFVTLFERVLPSKQLRSVKTGNHGYLHVETPVHQDVSIAGWVQVVHGGNVSNRVGGVDVRVDRSLLEGEFAIPEDAVPPASEVAAPQPEGAEARAAFRQDLESALVLPEDP